MQGVTLSAVVHVYFILDIWLCALCTVSSEVMFYALKALDSIDSSTWSLLI